MQLILHDIYAYLLTSSFIIFIFIIMYIISRNIYRFLSLFKEIVA